MAKRRVWARLPVSVGWPVSVGRTGVVRLAVVVAVLGLVVAAVPATSAVADGAPGGYGFTDDARSVAGATTTSVAKSLEPGRVYRSSLPANGRLYYRLDLDATSTAYVSATAVPGTGTTVSATDGLRVSVRDAQGNACSYQATRFGTSRSAHPIAAWGARDASPGHALCRGAGAYYVLVERIAATGSSSDAWPLELAAVTEPALERSGATRAPETWDSASPEPVGGHAVDRAGGAGFARAATVGQGVWQDRIRPGQTLFYRVPVDWGQQLNALAELGGAGGGSGYADGALTLSLYNPVRGYVEDAYAGYSGRPASAALAPLPPVAYANRYGFADQVKAMRFAGSYYLVVHLAAQTADTFGEGPYGLTLRVRVGGTARSGPGYAGRSEPRNLFEVTAGDRQAATEAGAGEGSAALRALAVGGIGAGTVLLLVLGVWTVAARRRAGAW
ncbi:hypothetical protein GCM10014715_19900 [Streptomyces spiralis]|uniref:Uncharacterized protein n=1 Tax=Streptomyces spiralis TaxID=66376 RepID=A0A918ZSB7_9ACTN|nr:hypothetical protein GCM10014715_19900 [Streptomyces spiralis]